MDQAKPRPESAAVSMPRTRSGWDQLLQVRRRSGAVVGRLVRPLSWRWCRRHDRGYFHARLEGVDTEGVELDVAMVEYDKRTTKTALCDLGSVQVGTVIFAEGEIEVNNWAPSSVRMLVKSAWPIDRPPLLMSADTLCSEDETLAKFRAFEKAQAEAAIAGTDVSDPLGHVADLKWIRRELARKRAPENLAIDSYVWGVVPDIDYAAGETDPEMGKRLFYESEYKRDALQQLVELALDGNMIAAMQVFGGFGVPGSDDKEAVLKGMLRGVEVVELIARQAQHAERQWQLGIL